MPLCYCDNLCNFLSTGKSKFHSLYLQSLLLNALTSSSHVTSIEGRAGETWERSKKKDL